MRNELEKENHMSSCPPNQVLNAKLTLEEVKKVIAGAKVNKATGIEDLPNEVLKSPELLNTLYSFKHVLKVVISLRYGINLSSSPSLSLLKKTPEFH